MAALAPKTTARSTDLPRVANSTALATTADSQLNTKTNSSSSPFACPGDQVFFKGICLDACPDKYVADASGYCVKAINCSNREYEYNGTCVKTCPENYYADDLTRSCRVNDGFAKIPVQSASSNATNSTQANTTAPVSSKPSVAKNATTKRTTKAPKKKQANKRRLRS